MTTIETREELLAIPDGKTIRVIDPRNGRKAFTKQGEEFVGEYGTITTEMLDAALAASAIEEGPVWQAGQVLQVGPYYEWYVLRVDDTDGVHSAKVMKVYEKFYTEELSTEVESPDTATVITSLDERQQALKLTGEFMLNRDRNVERTAVRAFQRTQAEQQSGVITSITRSIHSAMESFDDDDDRRRMRDVLQSHGLEVPTLAVDFTIEISGTSTPSLAVETGRAALGHEDVSINVDEATATIQWTRTIEVEDQYTGNNGDPCEDRDFIDEDWVRRHLVDEGFEFDHYSVSIESRSCSHC